MNTDIKSTRLGWLQLSILTMLWNKEMYGLQIQKNLKSGGNPIKAPQLYAALNHLEQTQLLISRIEPRTGASRKYYRISESGMRIIMDYFMNFIVLIEGILWDKILPLLSNLIDKIAGKPQMSIVDFSSFYSDHVFEKLIPRIVPQGHYYLICRDENQCNVFIDKIKDNDLQRIVSPILLHERIIDIPSESMDFAFCFFTLDESDQDWILPELQRVLKLNGTGVIINVLAPEQEDPQIQILFDFLGSYIRPQHSQWGIRISDLQNQLQINNLKITNDFSIPGFLYIFLQKIESL